MTEVKKKKYFRDFDPEDPWDEYMASIDFNELPEAFLKKILEEDKKRQRKRGRYRSLSWK